MHFTFEILTLSFTTTEFSKKNKIIANICTKMMKLECTIYISNSLLLK